MVCDNYFGSCIHELLFVFQIMYNILSFFLTMDDVCRVFRFRVSGRELSVLIECFLTSVECFLTSVGCFEHRTELSQTC